MSLAKCLSAAAVPLVALVLVAVGTLPWGGRAEQGSEGSERWGALERPVIERAPEVPVPPDAEGPDVLEDPARDFHLTTLTGVIAVLESRPLSDEQVLGLVSEDGVFLLRLDLDSEMLADHVGERFTLSGVVRRDRWGYPIFLVRSYRADVFQQGTPAARA